MSSRILLPLLIGLVVGAAGTFSAVHFAASKPAPTAVVTPTTQAEPPPETIKKESPPLRGLDANLYMQTAAEYRACCLQAFYLAEERVKAKVAMRTATEPAAVVFDLDETVFDNGVYQARQLRSGTGFDQKVWDVWEEKDGERVRLVPGAKEFIAKLSFYKVRPVFISNRNDKFRKQTHEVLKRLDIDVPDEQLLLADKTSDKTERRATVTGKFDVLLWVGDNLRDFDEAFKYDKATGIDGRKAAVDDRRAKFGADWILLPNVSYGEWTKAFANSPEDVDLLTR
jgi:5'-nucleotidase (lipoprotein e(P4) family)